MLRHIPIAFFILLVACSSEDKQDLIDAAPKQIELNVHFPIPVEAWPLPDMSESESEPRT